MDAQRPRGSRWWVWLILACAALALGYFLVTRIVFAQAKTTSGRGAGGAGRAVPVVAARARRGNMNLYLTGLGTVTPYNTVTVRTRVDGQIVKIYFTEGQIVKESDPLVDIDPRPFQVQLEQAEGQLAKDQSLLRNAQLDLERYQSIKTSITQQQIDTQQALVNQYAGSIKSDQGQVDNAKLQLIYCHVTAQIPGRIGLRLIDMGNIVHASDQQGLAVITQLQPIAIVFTIPEDEISRVMQRPDHGDGLQVDAFSQDLTQIIASGKVLAIDNQADPTTGMVRIKAEFQNADYSLFPNQFVNARLLVDTLRGVLIVPAAAVQRGPNNETFVYIVNKDNAVELRRNIAVGPTEGDQTVIESAIEPAEVVVTDGVDKLQNGTKVTVRQQASRGATTRSADATTQGAGAATNPLGAATRPSGATTFPASRAGSTALGGAAEPGAARGRRNRP